MPFIYQHRIYRKDLQANPQVLYVFGDNQARCGLGGQAAEMRGEPNAIGVATLDANIQPYSDRDFDSNVRVLNADFQPIFAALRANKLVVFPLDGIGTGIADMPRRAPKTFAHLKNLVAHAERTRPAFTLLPFTRR